MEGLSKNPDRTSLHILHNWGMGDAIVLNGLVRWLAKRNPHTGVVYPCANWQRESLRYMWRDEPLIKLRVIGEGDEGTAIAYCRRQERFIVVGDNGPTQSTHTCWVSFWYEQWNLPVEARWSMFHVERDRTKEVKPPEEPYMFVHTHSSWGDLHASIPDNGLRIVRPTQAESPNIFGWLSVIENAREVHVVDSAFLNLIDSFPDVPPSTTLLYYHYNARRTARPRLKRPWKLR